MYYRVPKYASQALNTRPIRFFCIFLLTILITMEKQEDKEEKDEKNRSDSTRPIQKNRSSFAYRLKTLIGDDSIRAFARKCNVHESTIRTYLSGGKTPRMDHLISISSVCGVTTDWLATGKGIKYTRDLKHAEERLRGAPPAVLPELPKELEPYRKRLDALLTYLSMIDDDEERSQIIDSFVLRAQDKVDLDPLKDYFTKMKANNTK